MSDINFLNYGDLIHPHALHNIYHRRCDVIKSELREKMGITANVYRHHLSDKLYYVLEVKPDNFSDEIANGLNIPKEWVHFIHTNDDYSLYWIDEVKLHEKYLTDDGELCFRDEYDLMSDIHPILCCDAIRERLQEHGLPCKEVKYTNELLLLYGSSYPNWVAKVLNVPEENVIDVSEICSDLSTIVLCMNI